MGGDPEDGGGLMRPRTAPPVLALLVLTTAAPAAAQVFQEARPATPEQIAAAKGAGDRMIAKAKAEGVFANDSRGAVIQLRHIQSGLICQFLTEPANGLAIYPGLARGEDVSCGVNIGKVSVTLYATRYAPPKTVQAVLRESVAAMRSRIADLAPYVGTTASLQSPAKPGHVKPAELTTLRFTGTVNGAPTYTRSSAAACGPWIVAERVSAPVDGAMAADVAGDLELEAATDSVCNAATPG
jgi:hypothetical protein